MSASKTTKTWILTRSQTYEPGKSLRLGQVLLDPRRPADALFSKSSSFLPIPAEYTRDLGEKNNVTIKVESKLNASFTAWGKLNSTPVTAKGNAATNQWTTKKWILQKLESETFLPELEYVKEILKRGDVPAATKWWRLQRRIFLVTGVRIARGASVSLETDSHKTSASIKAGLDGSSQGVPVQAGLGAALGQETEQIEKAEESSDFVFAYRLHEITWIAGVDKRVYTGGDVESVRESHAPVDQQVKSDADEITGYELESLELFDEEGDVDDMVE
ncbi:uncharacterized protein TRIVIDRAFT_63373 [Trichoderma virens Gv29-8]|uniref:Uncharacterized protein n=1 Tax=Hypocrea virens (strain Gv29-8 / FGSC 10586) TaxID=413071 RepID=G9MH51_HYPVG|nr:uncharacterized protein TRIVIDRAFT_63373 [Trichoderma virens Gv29-8]EHK26041.1 hypothetical protein TRIVIDRAFT_63373 [Trichoderma virens Gv29-8]UKZ46226.1 hypothetical protein TrVGV298_000427 [Trichoderma virens]